MPELFSFSKNFENTRNEENQNDIRLYSFCEIVTGLDTTLFTSWSQKAPLSVVRPCISVAPGARTQHSAWLPKQLPQTAGHLRERELLQLVICVAYRPLSHSSPQMFAKKHFF